MDEYYKRYFVAYHFAFNKGSEWQLAENKYDAEERAVFLIPRHQFDILKLHKRNINGINFIKYRTNLIICIEPTVLLNREPKIYNLQRLQYIFWLNIIKNVLTDARMDRKIRVTHVNFAQILTSYGKRLNSNSKLKFMPLGGQGRWYKVKFLANHRRFVNFLLTEVVYRIRSWYDLEVINKTVVHPVMQEFFGCKNVRPAISLPEAEFRYSIDVSPEYRGKVLYCGRNVYFKLPELHFKLFKKLAVSNPNLEFLLIGRGWKPIAGPKNLRVLGGIGRNELLSIMEECSCGINLSLELAGFVNLEMASRMCPVICADSFGADYLLEPSQDFKIDLENSSFNLIYSHINKLLSANSSIFLEEAMLQHENARRWSIS